MGEHREANGKPRVELSIGMRKPIEVAQLNVYCPGLPDCFEGYRIVQLSDFHYGPLLSAKNLQQIIDVANKLQPDLCLLTGDLIQNGTIGLRHYLATKVDPKTFRWMSYRRKIRTLSGELATAIAEINATDGIYGVFGNHDYLEGIGTISRQLSGAVNWLKNSATTITRGNHCFALAGIDDLRYGKPDLAKTARSLNKDAFFKLIMSHNPDITLDPQAKEIANYDLLLCGHTHGGQICLPGKIPIFTQTKQRRHTNGLSYFTPNTKDPNTKDPEQKTPVYVSRGVGYGSISLRIFCPPEITLVTLTGTE